ncbi:hypothetical protein ACMT4L_16715 [Deinococcus sp. A31D244]|uniref:hypothetical protein n=1 Tax=Deinococcus sp. A31D244 TaxID=3397675 RepID=UPI0039DF7A13
MNHLLDSLATCIETQNWSAALALALMVPDALSKLAYPEEIKVGVRYARWFDEFALPVFSVQPQAGFQHLLDGAVCYALRCAYLHSATTELEGKIIRQRVAKIRFTQTPGVHSNQFGDILFLDIGTFCADLLQAGRAYSQDRPMPFSDVELVLLPNKNGSVTVTIPGLGRVMFSGGTGE